jgi:hypothetical protein
MLLHSLRHEIELIVAGRARFECHLLESLASSGAATRIYSLDIAWPGRDDCRLAMHGGNAGDLIDQLAEDWPRLISGLPLAPECRPTVGRCLLVLSEMDRLPAESN